MILTGLLMAAWPNANGFLTDVSFFLFVNQSLIACYVLPTDCLMAIQDVKLKALRFFFFEIYMQLASLHVSNGYTRYILPCNETTDSCRFHKNSQDSLFAFECTAR